MHLDWESCKKVFGDWRSWVLVYVLLFVFIASFSVSYGDVWLDEAVSLRIAELSVSEIVGGVDSHPPVYYLLLKFWVWVSGDYTGRILSLSLAVFLLLSLALLSARLWSVSSALFVVALGSLSGVLVEYGSETRMYVLVMVLLLWSWWHFRDERPWLGSLLWVVACFTHVYAVFFIAWVPFVVNRYRHKLSLVVPVVVGCFVVLPLLITKLSVGVGVGDWLPSSSGLLVGIVSHFVWVLQVPSSGLLWLSLAEFVLVGCLFFIFRNCYRCEMRWLGFLVPLVVFVLGVFEVVPFHHRHLVMFLPFFLLLAGECWFWRFVDRRFLIVFLLFQLVFVFGFLSGVDTDLRDAFVGVDCPARVLHHSTFSLFPGEFYLPGCEHYLETSLSWEELSMVGGYFVDGGRLNFVLDGEYYDVVEVDGSLEVREHGFS